MISILTPPHRAFGPKEPVGRVGLGSNLLGMDLAIFPQMS